MSIFLMFCVSLAIELYNYENLQHYGFIQIGSQKVPVMFDTGSTRT